MDMTSEIQMLKVLWDGLDGKQYITSNLIRPSIVSDSPRVKKSAGRKGNRSARSKGRPSSAHDRLNGSAGSRTLQDMQTDLLRRTYRGVNSQSNESFTGLDSQQRATMPYGSTTHFLRQMAGVEKAKSSEPLSGRSTHRGPAYKTPEEYYDEVIALKKQIQQLTNDNSTLKLKLRRVEEDYIKKKREVEQLLDPTKNDEVRRTLAETKPDSGMVVHGLKQKILKLEEQLREKEAAYSKLQSDLKTTKIEETKIALEVCYKEIQRLRTEKLAPAKPATSPRRVAAAPQNQAKVKLLTSQLMKSNVEKNRMATEIKALKEDLQKCMDSKQEKSRPRGSSSPTRKEYEDMNRKELLSTIARLEKNSVESDSRRRDEADRRQSAAAGGGGYSAPAEGKLALDGSVNQRLDQLDKRETELLKKLEEQENLVKKLRDDRAYYRTKCDEKDEEIRQLKKELSECQKQIQQQGQRDAGRDSGRHSPRSVASRHTTSRHSDEDDDEPAEFLQSAIRGYQTQSHSISRLKQRDAGRRSSTARDKRGDDSRDEDDDGDDTAEFLQSNLRGHNYRKQQLNRRNSGQSPRGSRSIARANSRSAVLSDDERRESVTTRPARPSGRTTPKGTREERSGSRGRRTPSRVLSDDDDDEGIVVNKGKPRSAMNKFF